MRSKHVLSQAKEQMQTEKRESTIMNNIYMNIIRICTYNCYADYKQQQNLQQ